MAVSTGNTGGSEEQEGKPRDVAGLSYANAGAELDAIIEEFETGVTDVDRLVERLERATDIVDELDRRLRRTRMQVEELVPRLEAIGRDAADDGEGSEFAAPVGAYEDGSEGDPPAGGLF